MSSAFRGTAIAESTHVLQLPITSRPKGPGIDRGSLKCQVAPKAEPVSQISANPRGSLGVRSNYLRAAKTCLLASQKDNLTCNHDGHPQSCSVTSEAHVGQVDKVYIQLMLCL